MDARSGSQPPRVRAPARAVGAPASDLACARPSRRRPALARRASGALLAPAPTGMNPKHTFANFVVGPSNQLAHAAAIAAAGGGGPPLQPALHLRRHRARQDAPRARHRAPRPRRAPDARIIYVSAEQFTNEFIQLAPAPPDGRVPRALPRAAATSCSSTTSSSSPAASRRRKSSSTRSTRSTRPTSRSSSRATSTRSSSSGWRSASSRASRGASSPTSRCPSSRRASRSSARRRRSRDSSSPTTSPSILAQSDPLERPRARRHAHPPRREVARSPAARSTSTSRRPRSPRRRRAPRRDDERRGHPARRLPPLPPALDRSALEGSPQERRVRAPRRDVPLQAAPQVQLPRARPRVRQPRPHDGDERRPQGRAAQRDRTPRCAPTSRRSSASSATAD